MGDGEAFAPARPVVGVVVRLQGGAEGFVGFDVLVRDVLPEMSAQAGVG